MRDPRTLLEIVARPGTPGLAPHHLLEDSIRFNLNELFSSMLGSARAEPDYGLPDAAILLRSWGSGASHVPLQPGVEEFKGLLRQAIERYEPRLRIHQLSARILPGVCIQFELRASILEAGRPLGEFRATAQLQSSGRMSLS